MVSMKSELPYSLAGFCRSLWSVSLEHDCPGLATNMSTMYPLGDLGARLLASINWPMRRPVSLILHHHEWDIPSKKSSTASSCSASTSAVRVYSHHLEVTLTFPQSSRPVCLPLRENGPGVSSKSTSTVAQTLSLTRQKSRPT